MIFNEIVGLLLYFVKFCNSKTNFQTLSKKKSKKQKTL